MHGTYFVPVLTDLSYSSLSRTGNAVSWSSQDLLEALTGPHSRVFFAPPSAGEERRPGFKGCGSSGRRRERDFAVVRVEEAVRSNPEQGQGLRFRA